MGHFCDLLCNVPSNSGRVSYFAGALVAGTHSKHMPMAVFVDAACAATQAEFLESSCIKLGGK